MYSSSLLRSALGGAFFLTIVVACDPPVPKDRGASDDAPPQPTTASSDAGSSGQQTRSAPEPREDAGATGETDAGDDAAPTAKLPYGSPCTSDDQCSGGLCEKIRDALVCTQICERDRDCPDRDDCKDNICRVGD